MRSVRPGVRRSRSDQPHRRSGRSRVTFYHPTRAFALHVEPKRNRRRSKIAVRCRRTGGGSEQRCQNLSASGGCSRAQIHRRTQDNGFDRHASIRVSGPNKAGETPSAALVMTSRTPPEALNPQKGNIMSIIRHEIRKISDENRDQPIISQAEGVPLICPTCQVLPPKASLPAPACYFAWGCFRYFCWEP